MSPETLRTERNRAQAAEDREGSIRFALVVVGVAMGGFGVLLLLTRVALSDFWPLVRWGAAGILVHDGLLAPIAVGVGLVVLPRVAARSRRVLRTGLLAAGCLALLGVALSGARSVRQNATVLDVHPLVAIGVAGSAFAVALTLSLIWTRLRARRTPSAVPSP